MVTPPTCPAYHHVLMVARIQHRAACDDLAGVLDLCDLQAAGGGPETVDAIVADALCLADAAQIAAWVCRFRRLSRLRSWATGSCASWSTAEAQAQAQAAQSDRALLRALHPPPLPSAPAGPPPGTR